MKKKLLVFLLTLALAALALPTAVFAEGTETVTDFDGFKEALANPTCTAIELAGDITLTENVTDPVTKNISLASGKTITLDLNGYTLNTAKTIIVQGAVLNISGAGSSALCGSMNPVIRINAGGTVVLQSGSVQGTGSTVVQLQARDSTFTISSGEVLLAADGSYAVAANYGTVNVQQGSIRVANTANSGLYLASNATVNMGTVDSNDHENPYVQSIRYSSNSDNLKLHSGLVGSLYYNKDLGSGSVLNCWFESDVSNAVDTIGKICEPVAGETGKWQVTEPTVVTYVASVDGTQYPTLAGALAAMKNGSTLKLLDDCDEPVSLDNVYAATIDLNGFSINNGLTINPKYGTAPSGQNLVTVTNSGTAGATIRGETPLTVSSGDSSQYLSVVVDASVALSPTSGGSAIELGTSSRIAYSDKNAGYITNGGFKATHADGTAYIYGTFAAAAAHDKDHTALLLHDYITSSDYISVSEAGQYILDLGGHTITANGRSNGAAIQVQANNASLLVKNGSIISNGDGAWVGVGTSSGHYSNVSLTLEQVNLSTSAADAYGIVSNGISTDVNITVRGGSVNSTNGIGIYMPSDKSTLEIDGASVSGQTGVAIKGGSVTVKGAAKLTGTGAYKAPQPTSSGVTNTGDALYVEGNYGWSIQVNIASGDFTSTNGDAVRMLEDAGEGNSQVVSITGGTFSSDPSKYLANGYKLTGNAANGFGVIAAGTSNPTTKPESKPSGSSTPAATAAPAPAAGVLDSTPKTGAVSLAVLPLAGLAFAGLGFAGRKRR